MLKEIKLRNALLLIFSGWLLSVILSVFIYPGESSGQLGRSSLSILELTFFLPTVIFIYIKGGDWPSILRFKIVPLPALAGVAVFALATPILFDTVDRLVFRMFDIPEAYWEMLEIYRWEGPGTFLQIFLAMVLIGPFVEELLFRGMLQQSLEKHHGNFWQAALAVALLFSFIHTAPWVFLQVFVYSLILSILSTGFNSIIPGILLHGIHNFIQLILHNLPTEQLGWYEANGLVRIPVIIFAGIILYPGLKIILRYLQWPESPSNEKR